jgi:hypothetical protein
MLCPVLVLAVFLLTNKPNPFFSSGSLEVKGAAIHNNPTTGRKSSSDGGIKIASFHMESTLLSSFYWEV